MSRGSTHPVAHNMKAIDPEAIAAYANASAAAVALSAAGAKVAAAAAANAATVALADDESAVRQIQNYNRKPAPIFPVGDVQAPRNAHR